MIQSVLWFPFLILWLGHVHQLCTRMVNKCTWLNSVALVYRVEGDADHAAASRKCAHQWGCAIPLGEGATGLLT